MENGIDRREAIKRTAIIMGCTLSGGLVSAVLKGCAPNRDSDWKPSLFSQKQLQVAADLAEVILPETETPGAKSNKTERFIDSMAADWMAPEEREILLNGINRLADVGFTDLSFEDQNRAAARLISDDEGARFFRLFKQVTLLGFFTSETGATQVLNYDPVPGSYSGCISLEEAGGRTWAT
jgi:gluconate 2-dehydrogenase gamma chain